MVIWSLPIISTTKLHSTWYSKMFQTLLTILPKYRQNIFLICRAVIKHGKSEKMWNMFVETLAGRETLERHNHRSVILKWICFIGEIVWKCELHLCERLEAGLSWKEGGKHLKIHGKMCLILLNMSFCGSRNTFLFLDFKLSPCSLCCMFSSG